MCVCIVVSAASVAQEPRPEITPLERKAQRKKDHGPRAVALLRMGKDGKTSLLPIAILINGKFWDASAYRADPVPMALDSGTVYEAERSGSSLGLFTVGSALHSNAENAPIPWLGTGVWHPAGSEAEKKPVKAYNVPLGIFEVDAPPRLTRKTSTAVDAPPGKEAPSSGSTSSTSSASTNRPPSSAPEPRSPDSDEPPRLTKPMPPPSSAPPATSGSGSASASAQPKENIAVSDSGAGEANRPFLRRGKPEESFADEDVPGYSKPGERLSATKKPGGNDILAESDIQLIPAISDAGGPTPHSFGFEWYTDEEAKRRKQMGELARQKLRAYLAALAKATITPQPERPATKRRAEKPVEPIFENEKMVAYDLWNSNQPIIVYSVTAHMPPSASGSATAAGIQGNVQYFILLVAYPDIYDNLHTLYSGITDKFHLDVTPRLDLIDAVDADGDGDGELLFRETSDVGTGWAIYRATADKLYELYDSLNPG